MHILPIGQNFNNKKMPSKKVNFGTNSRVVRDDLGMMLYRTTTAFFRDDLDWIGLVKYLNKKYAKIPKVNIVEFGCSSGEETFSIIISLIKYLGKKAEKFFPVIARDIDEENIKDAKRGNLFATEQEKCYIEDAILGENFYDRYYVWDKDRFEKTKFVRPSTKKINKYLEFEKNEKFDDDSWYKYKNKNKYRVILDDEIRSKANFSVGNVLTDIRKMPRENTVLFIRNLWPYLSLEDQELLFGRIAKHYKGTNSVIVFGEYDEAYNASAVLPISKGQNTDNGSYVRFGLYAHNFKKTKLENVFEM